MKEYIKPMAEISAFESEEPIALSGVNKIIGEQNAATAGQIFTTAWKSEWNN